MQISTNLEVCVVVSGKLGQEGRRSSEAGRDEQYLREEMNKAKWTWYWPGKTEETNRIISLLVDCPQ